MSDLRAAWWEMMKAKYNTDEEGVRQIMRDRQKAGDKRKKELGITGGGFNAMTKEQLKEVSRKGVEARRGRKTKE